MIYDTYHNRQRYFACHKSFALAFAFLERVQKENLSPGKYALDGNDVYASVQEYITKPDSGTFEGHRNYIDIQYMVSGEERMEYAGQEQCCAISDYSAESDVAFFACNGAKGSVELTEGCFAVFFPWDIHKPGIQLDAQQQVKKVVVKVRL